MRADVAEVFLLRFRLELDHSRPANPGVVGAQKFCRRCARPTINDAGSIGWLVRALPLLSSS